MKTNHLEEEKLLIKRRFTKALSSYNEHALVQQQIHYRLIDLLKSTGRSSFDRILEIGCGTGAFTHQLTRQCSAHEWIVNDLFENCIQKVAECFLNKSWKYLAGDAEELSFPGIFDMVTSASVIQWFHSPGHFIQKMASRLTNRGILLLNTFGLNNLHEIKIITGKGLAYLPLNDIRKWAEPYFDILHLQEEEIKLHFPTPMQVLYHLKHTGVTGTNTSAWTRRTLQSFCEEYNMRYSADGKVALTYHPIYLLAIRK